MASERATPQIAVVSAAGEAAPPGLVAALTAASDRLAVRSGQIVLAAGTRSSDVYIVLSGALRVTIYAADGREVVMRDQLAGSFFGDLAAIDGGRRSASIVAVQDSQLLTLRGTDFHAAALATPEAAGWFAVHLAAQIRSLTERVLELSTLNVRSRLHCHLLRLCAVTGVIDNKSTLDPSPTHEVLATMIGSNREAVTREFSYLTSVGIIEQARRRLEVKDVERLSNLVKNAVGSASG